jgi:hypothetical protein
MADQDKLFDDERAAESTGSRRKAAPVIRLWGEIYEKEHSIPYQFHFKRDGAILASLEKTFGIERLERAMEQFHKLPGDDYLNERGYDVPAFQSRVQGVMLKLQRGEARLPVDIETMQRGIATLEEFLADPPKNATDGKLQSARAHLKDLKRRLTSRTH